MIAAPAPFPLTSRQRLRVAQRLAAGDSVEEAAGLAEVEAEAVDAVLGCPRFQALLATQAAKAALSDEAWARQMKVMVRQAAEVALADGKVSTVNTLLRASLVLPALAATSASRVAALQVLDRIEAAVPEEPEPDETPASEPAPAPASPDEAARRQELLAAVNPVLRPMLESTRLELLEHYVAATHPDPTVYEAWFAAQPKPAFAPAALAEEDAAAIRHVTRHNPPWLKGEYLGYYRPPVPTEAFQADAAGRPATSTPLEPETVPAPAAPAPAPALDLRTRTLRLLDRAAVRRPEELDLAEAICALRWPKWPTYRGPIDLDALRRALKTVAIDPDTLHWLGSDELAQACRKAAAGPSTAQGP